MVYSATVINYWAGLSRLRHFTANVQVANFFLLAPFLSTMILDVSYVIVLHSIWLAPPRAMSVTCSVHATKLQLLLLLLLLQVQPATCCLHHTILSALGCMRPLRNFYQQVDHTLNIRKTSGNNTNQLIYYKLIYTLVQFTELHY